MPMLYFRVGLSCSLHKEGFRTQLSLDLSLLFADDQQDPQEVALTSLSPNGNYEEAAGGAGT